MPKITDNGAFLTGLPRQNKPSRGAFSKNVFWKYTANLQETTYADVWFQQSFFATLLKSYFGMGVFL